MWRDRTYAWEKQKIYNTNITEEERQREIHGPKGRNIIGNQQVRLGRKSQKTTSLGIWPTEYVAISKW